jgi:hypothetical protein
MLSKKMLSKEMLSKEMLSKEGWLAPAYFKVRRQAALPYCNFPQYYNSTPLLVYRDFEVDR